MSDAFNRNRSYLANIQKDVRTPAPSYNTSLPQLEEWAFRSWLVQNRVPFNAEAPVTDYDMRGFWRAMQGGDPRATSAINQNDGQMHYPDIWKTPHHATFSEGSQWAGPVAPKWTPDDKLISPGGRILSDERAPPRRSWLESL